MPNIAQVLKEEIARIARKQIKQETLKLQRDSIWLKKSIASLKRQITSLERGNRLLCSEVSRQRTGSIPRSDELKKMRVTGAMIRSLRTRLKISQANLAKLIGVSGQSVYQWERKKGGLRLRQETKVALHRIRKMGVREARVELEKL